MIKRIWKEESEDGAILILYAFLFVIMVGFLALGCDYSVAKYRGNQLDNYIQIFTNKIQCESDPFIIVLWSSDQPEKVIYDNMDLILSSNDFKGDMTIGYEEHALTYNPQYNIPHRRAAKAKISLTSEVDTMFLKLFGIEKLQIHRDGELKPTHENLAGSWTPYTGGSYVKQISKHYE